MMQMTDSVPQHVHDCVVTRVIADCEARTLMLHATGTDDRGPFEIIFNDVRAWSVDNVLEGNILFAIEDIGTPNQLPDELVPASDQREFVISSSYGMTGRVIGSSWTTRPRSSE